MGHWGNWLSIRKQVGFPKWNQRQTSINKMKVEFSFYDGQKVMDLYIVIDYVVIR